MTSFPLSLPDTKNVRIGLTPKSLVGLSVCPWNFKAQVQQFSSQILMWDVTCTPKTRDEAEAWISFFMKLDGVYGTFLLGDNTRKALRGVGGGTPLVKGANQEGNVLETDGWPHGVTGVVADGDWIQLPGYRHHRICGAANSDGSGNATLTIYPRLRESPADNAAITVANTVGLYRMLTNDSNIDIGTDTNVSVQFTAVEAL